MKMTRSKKERIIGLQSIDFVRVQKLRRCEDDWMEKKEQVLSCEHSWLRLRVVGYGLSQIECV